MAPAILTPGTIAPAERIVPQEVNLKPVKMEDTPKENKTEAFIAKTGMECDIKNLYQKEDAMGRVNWTEKYPEDLDEAAENEITARYAVLVRNKKSFDSRKKLEVDSIVVQSPLLKKILSKVLEDYPGKSSLIPPNRIF
jgi:hypothetical protein